MRIGIDLGGTKIAGVVLDGSAEVARVRVDTPQHDYPATLDAITALVLALEARSGARCTVGVGIPGTISPTTGLVKNANSVWLNGRPLGIDLARLLDREIRVENDANCFAVSEAADGAAAGAAVVFGVIAGTGTGGGIVVRGELLTGANAIAGEWGHNPLPWPEDDEQPGPACYCGKRGCVETYLSGPAMEADYVRRTGERRSAPDIVTLAFGGHAEAAATLGRYEHRFARALAAVINVLDPDVVVLGGGMSNIDRLYTGIPPVLERFVFACGIGETVRTRILRARHGDSSGVRGAAWLWPEPGGRATETSSQPPADAG
jgi:fructokinase